MVLFFACFFFFGGGGERGGQFDIIESKRVCLVSSRNPETTFPSHTEGWSYLFTVVFFCYIAAAVVVPGVTHCACCRDEEFSAAAVSPSDVIHANKKDIPSIFRVGI